MSTLHERIEQAVAEAVGDTIKVENVSCTGYIVEVSFSDRRMRIGSGSVQSEVSALQDLADISTQDETARAAMGLVPS